MKRQLVTLAEADFVTRQHTKPCSDCPFARTALNGWLGGTTVEQWVIDVHGETRIDCHTKIGAQCAGAALYRANVAKVVRDPEALRLPPNRRLVFASPAEFIAHHRAHPRLRKG